MLISTVDTAKKNLHPNDEKLSSFHAAKHTASEPMTCIDGQTFVLVSKLYSFDAIIVNILCLSKVSGLKFCSVGKIIYITSVIE